MYSRLLRNMLLIVGMAGVCVLLITSAGEVQANAKAVSAMSSHFAVSSSSAPADPSPEAQKALAYISQQQGIPIDQLIVANEFRRSAALLNRTFQAVTVLETQGGRFFQLLVDLDSGQVEERASVEDAEAQASNATYGKFQPALYERLQQLKDTDTVTVTLIVADAPGQSLGEREIAARTALAAKYPEARAAIARHGKPMDVDDPVLAAQIYKEYVALLDGDQPQRVGLIVAALKAQGFSPRTTAGLPAVTVNMPKAALLALALRGDVGTIFLAEAGPGHPTLDTATKTNRAPVVWSRSYDGSGVKVAILEDTNVDFTSPGTAQCSSSSNNCFLHPGAIRPAYNNSGPTPWHSTLVASAVASNNATYKGMAPGATILSAGMSGSIDQDMADALDWALDPNQGAADVVNTSYGWCPGRYMSYVDWAYDYYARTRLRLLVASAGNNNNIGCNDDVFSPGMAWNVLTVGASDDINDSDWSNDVMWSHSSYLNPITPNGDHEKPEVVAPGSNITGIGLDGQIVTPIPSGTSFSSPQVAGEAALLIHRNPQLRSWPEALRAIIMATATNNVLGPTGLPSGQDLRDGAGGINADLADIVATTKGAIPSTSANACNGPCWWGETVTANDFVAGNGYRYYQFNAQAGDRIRVAIAWDSYGYCSGGGNLAATTSSVPIGNCGDILASDLQLLIFAPSGSLVNNYSASFDNSYELVPPDGELVLPVTGTYKIGVYKQIFTDASNSLGVAWTKLPATTAMNLAEGKGATQSPTLSGAAASRAVDGTTDGNYYNGSVSHTISQAQPWWQVDLGSVQDIGAIEVWNRTDCCGSRLSNFYVLVSDVPFVATDLTMARNQAGVSSYYIAGQGGTPTRIGVYRTGQFVRVQLAGTDYLALAEVRVFEPANLADGKNATQSSELPGAYVDQAPAYRANDGNTDGNYANGSVSHTNSQAQSWWQVDLGAVQSIGTIQVWNRTDCCANRLTDFYVLVSDVPFVSTDLTTARNQAGVSSYYTAGQGGTPTKLAVNRSGRYVRVQLNGTNYLALAEVKVFEPVNLAVGKIPTQSTTVGGAAASRAADGNTDGNYYNNSVSHTDQQAQPYWTLNLGSVQDIGTIQVWNRTDCCANRLTNFYVFVSNTAFTSTNPTSTQLQAGVSTYYTAGQGGTPTTLAANRTGQYVRVQLAGTDYLALAEVQVWKLK